MAGIRNLFVNGRLLLAARLILGAIFLVSAVGKLQHPALFTDTVVEYGMLPEGLSRLYGAILPWAEVAIGISLILGLLSIVAAMAGMVLSISFAIAGLYSFSHPDVPALCGCFGELLTLNHAQSLALDLAMLAMSMFILIGFRNAEDLGLGPFITKKLNRGKWATAVPGLLLVGLMTLGLGLGIQTSTQQEGTRPAVSSYRLIYCWNGCRDCYGSEVDQVSSLGEEYSGQIDLVSVDYMVDPAAAGRYGVSQNEFTVILMSCQPGTDSCTEKARFAGDLFTGTFNLEAIRGGVEALLKDGGAPAG